MNLAILRAYIAEYENKFAEIHDKEIYKWRAVKQFQDTWDVDAKDFHGMLMRSLSATCNLLESANYWPRRMIRRVSEKWPNAVRSAFERLFDEEEDLLERINAFQATIDKLSKKLYPNANAFHDHRAILVYLSLRYPNDYFFYKFTVFKDFCKKVEHEYTPKRGRSENIIQVIETCKLIRGEIQQNNRLLKLHRERIKATEYVDTECNILTQDFMYAVSSYLSVDKKRVKSIQPRLKFVNFSLKPVKKGVRFGGRYVDFIGLHKRRKRIGDLGEQLVLEHERNKFPSKKEEIVIVSNSKGDGEGFDILSFDEAGKEKYIEVKTTTSGQYQPFFITWTELERSRKEGDNYYLYRLYNLNETKMTADVTILRGDLSPYCINPVQYEVIPKETKSEKE